MSRHGDKDHRMSPAPGRSKRIVLSCFGSLGDLHPYFALALELKARGHRPVIATAEIYRAKTAALGIEFHGTRPEGADLHDPATVAELAKLLDEKRGPELLLRDFLIPAVRGGYEDLTQAVRGADLLVTHPITFAGPIVAQKTQIPWAASVLAPLSLWSNHEPYVLGTLPWFHPVVSLGGPVVSRLIRKLIDRISTPWVQPLYEFRKELGLPRGAHPVFEGQYSPQLNLALFSKVLCAPQPDWPAHTQVTGFCFYDADEIALQPELQRFLDAGEPPIVFTLGSAAVFIAGDFFSESIEAARMLGRRAIFLVGRDDLRPAELPDTMAAFAYAPFGALFPRALAIVHSGGAGTMGQALRAGIPTLIVPFSNDQPDNAARTVRIGTGRTLARGKYKAARVARELTTLLENPAYAERARIIGAEVRAERGACAAADHLLQLITE
jgi:UDP:flavonoid glycosyltransferase YjiC (YdhE family)